MTALDELAVLERECARVSELLRSNDLATPIGHLGRWKVRDVGAHLGGVHRWASRIVTARSREGPGATKSKLDGVELCDWFDAGVGELLATLKANEPDGECPNFNPGSPHTVAWWWRRQMHETMVHRWDIEKAVSQTMPIDAEVAADGIDEYLDVFVRTRGKQTLAKTLVLASSHPSARWTLAPAKKPGRIDVITGAADESAATIAGEPDQLLLALWGRLCMSETGLTITGDEIVASSMVSL